MRANRFEEEGNKLCFSWRCSVSSVLLCKHKPHVHPAPNWINPRSMLAIVLLLPFPSLSVSPCPHFLLFRLTGKGSWLSIVSTYLGWMSTTGKHRASSIFSPPPLLSEAGNWFYLLLTHREDWVGGSSLLLLLLGNGMYWFPFLWVWKGRERSGSTLGSSPFSNFF